MAALQQRKVKEGLELMKEAEKYMKTSWLKWKPDYDSAADKYMKAGISFKAGRSYPEADDAFRRAADAYEHNHSVGAIAAIHVVPDCEQALEQAASVLKEMKRMTEAVELIESASMRYREHGTPDTAALALIKGAKMCEAVEPDRAIDMFLSAGELNVGEDKIREGIEPMIQAIRVSLKRKRYEDVINIKKKVIDLYKSLENFAMIYKTTLGLIVVYLHESDYVAADQCFKNSFSIPGFADSDEAQAAEKLLECFDEGDADGMKACTSQAIFTYLDNEIAKLARSLRVPGDLPDNPTRPSPKNELFDKPKVEVELEDSVDDNGQELENSEDTTESEAKAEDEDEFEGGLC